jgi:hypothetical protein
MLPMYAQTTMIHMEAVADVELTPQMEDVMVSLMSRMMLLSSISMLQVQTQCTD